MQGACTAAPRGRCAAVPRNVTPDGRIVSPAMVSAEQPFLFYPEGHDVRWRSFAEVAAQAEAGAASLADLGIPAGARVAFRWRPGPDAVAADLAVRAGGWTAVPVPVRAAAPVAADERWEGSVAELEGAAGELGCAALLLPPGVAPGDGAGLPRVVLPEADGGSAGRGGGSLPELPGSAHLRGAARVLSGEEIAAAGDRLEERLGAVRPEGGESAGRPVVVACFDASTADGRALLAWAERTAPALFLEPDRGSLAGSAAWARATVVAGEAEPVARLAAEIRRRTVRPPFLRRLKTKLTGRGGSSPPPRLAPRGPFGRLRAVVLLGGGLGADALATFAQHRLAVLRPDR